VVIFLDDVASLRARARLCGLDPRRFCVHVSRAKPVCLQARRALQTFYEDGSVRVFLLSLSKHSSGLTLTRANHVGCLCSSQRHVTLALGVCINFNFQGRNAKCGVMQ
jgi:hypothetical protein